MYTHILVYVYYLVVCTGMVLLRLIPMHIIVYTEPYSYSRIQTQHVHTHTHTHMNIHSGGRDGETGG